MQDDSRIEKIDIMHLLDGALRHMKHTWFLGVILVVLMAALGNLYTRKTYSPRYKVYATFVVTASTSSDSLTYTYTNNETTKQLNQTFPYILSSGALSKIVAQDLGYDSLPVSMSTEALGESNLFRIVVTGSDPQVCMDALKSVIENYPEVAKYILGTTKLDLVSMSKLPKKPYNNPNYKGMMRQFGLLGLMLYLALIFFRILTSRTVYSKEMLVKYISVPILGAIPQIGSKKKGRKNPIRIANDAVSGQYREAMETLRLRLSSKLEHRKWKTLYVTSSMAGEGKTTIACNLAVLMAQHGKTVMLVDADLRNPSVARTLGLERDKNASGMNDFLRGDASLEEIMIKSEITDHLVIFPGGKAVDRVKDQFTNGRFKKMIGMLRNRADLVIVDTPPCAMMDDTAMVAEFLEGGLLVVRKDYASIDAVIAGTELLGKTDSSLLACAMNFADGHQA